MSFLQGNVTSTVGNNRVRLKSCASLRSSGTYLVHQPPHQAVPFASLSVLVPENALRRQLYPVLEADQFSNTFQQVHAETLELGPSGAVLKFLQHDERLLLCRGRRWRVMGCAVRVMGWCGEGCEWWGVGERWEAVRVLLYREELETTYWLVVFRIEVRFSLSIAYFDIGTLINLHQRLSVACLPSFPVFLSAGIVKIIALLII